MRELVLRRPLHPDVPLEAIILRNPSLTARTLRSNLATASVTWLVLFQGTPTALDAVRTRYLESPPPHLARAEVVRETQDSVLAFIVERAAGPLGLSELIRETLDDALVHHEKTRDGASWTIWSDDAEKLARFARRLAKLPHDPLAYEIAATTSRPSVASPDTVLSPVEHAVLLAARRAGYYESPKRAHLTDIARMLKMPRATVHYHLKRAERKVLGATWLLPQPG